jgi:hypothetical protein
VPPILLALVCFSNRVSIIFLCPANLGLDREPSTSASCVAGIADMCHHTQVVYSFYLGYYQVYLESFGASEKFHLKD